VDIRKKPMDPARKMQCTGPHKESPIWAQWQMTHNFYGTKHPLLVWKLFASQPMFYWATFDIPGPMASPIIPVRGSLGYVGGEQDDCLM
jgi:hypothetical protein